MINLKTYAAQALISPMQLSILLAEHPEKIRILDASYGIGVRGMSPEAVFPQMRIGSAQYFDIDAVADQQAPLPHTLPSPEDFADAVGKLGISHEHLVVIYDQTGIVNAACRAWWMFRVFGHDLVCVLDGGVPAWHAAGLPFATGTPEEPVPQNFSANYRPERAASYQEMRGLIGDSRTVIVDTRPPERFEGGHMPGARNLPTAALIDPHTRGLLEKTALSEQLDSLGIPKETPVVTSCNSGVTACVTALALLVNGYENIKVYDGSWSEWRQQEFDSPVVKGFE